MKKRFMSLALASLLSFSVCLTACEEGNQSSGAGGSVPAGEFVATTRDIDISYEDTQNVLVENGESDYTIVVAESTPWQVTQAVDEFNIFFEKATGATLPIVKDTSLSFDETKKYLSFGRNKVFEGSGMNLTYDEYDEDGFHIKTFGSLVIIAGAEENGAMYGVYDFLYYNLGIRCYSNDEFKIPDYTQSKVYLKDFDHKSVPDFGNRSLGLSYQRYPAINEYRLSLNQNNGKNWLTWCHTHFQLLPKATYFEAHRDWYSDDGSQLCLTNEEMRAEMINVVKAKIEASGTKHGLFMLGHEDVGTFCQCPNCTVAARENGGYAGVMMLFINAIAREMNVWMEETYGDTRSMKWVTFAYGKTVEPPVKQVDGKYVPFNENVVAEKNVCVMLAPLGLDWAHNMTDIEHNPRYALMIDGWKTLQAEFCVYSYNVVFDNQWIFMDTWSTVKDQYKTWIDMNAIHIFDQGASFINLPFFEMTSYVRSRLLWDVDADVEYYINDFIDNYYKAGAPYVKEYLNLVRTRYKLIEKEKNANGELFHQYSYVRTDPDLHTQAYWPKDWLLNGIAIYDKAIAAVEAMEEGEAKEKALRRVKAERLSPIYLLMSLYATEMSDGDIVYYCNLFREGAEANSITYWHEHAASKGDTVNSLINEWMAHVG